MQYAMSSSKVWSKGDQCQVVWPEDGELYDARIRKIRKEGGRVTAVVAFDGFASDEEEEYDVCELKSIQKVPTAAGSEKTDTGSSRGCHGDCSFIRPLRAEEEELRLEQKYGNLSDSDDFSPSPAVSPVKTKGKVSQWQLSEGSTQAASRRQKGKVVSGGTPRAKTSTSPGSSKQSQQPCRPEREAKAKPEIVRGTDSPQQTVGSSRAAANRSPHGNQELSGFTEDDMEKPKFTFTPTAAKTPFLLSPEGVAPVVQIPAILNQYLRDYQREGVKFMYSHYEKGRGAILGDDMGLGKTVQVIAFLAALLNKQGNRVDIMKRKPKFIRRMSENVAVQEDWPPKVFLIIGPGSVLYNWLDELETWGHFAVGKYHGAEKESCLLEVERGKLEIVVTTFETCRDNIETLNSIDWDAVIVDEVHRIKGLQARTTQALRSLNTRKRFGLTGTALQNLMTELWCILDWAQPGALGDLNVFLQEYVQVIERGQRHDARKRELADARKQKEKFANIRKEIMLRRTKSLIADQLPQKDDNVVLCRMTELQLSVYKAILEHPSLRLVLGMDDPCSCQSGRIASKCCSKRLPDGGSVKGMMFTFMHLLLKAANHVALLVPDSRGGKEQSPLAQEVCRAVFQQHPQFLCQARQASFRTLSDPKYCGKMKVLQGLLSVFHKSRSKVLVFSYSTRLLDILEQYVVSTGHEYRRLDGSVSAKRRMQFVREFNRDPNIFVFLISTKAGGLGLNLTGANRVVIFDPNWNPSHDLQAQDRAYRIGQRKNVQVFRLISAGTIEENVYLRQVYKQQLDCVAVSTLNAKRLFRGIQGDRRNKGELFGVKNMFQLRTGDSCLTMDVLERNSKIENCLAGFDIAPYVPSSLEMQQEEEQEEDGEDAESSDDEKKETTDSEFSIFREMLYSGPDDDIDCQSVNFLCNEMLGEEEEEEEEEENQRRLGRRRRKPSKSRGSEEEPVPGPSKRKPGVKSRGSEAASSPTKLKSRPARSASSFDSIADVFDQCGVVHVHENRRVTGASKAEDHMTRCAMQEVYELHRNSQVPAMVCQPFDPSSEEEEEEEPAPAQVRGRRGTRKREPDHNAPRTLQHGKSKVLVGQTPSAFRRKQFGELAGKQGLSQTELAERVVRASDTERLQMLQEFYSDCHPDLLSTLEPLFSRPGPSPQPAAHSSPRALRTPRTPRTPQAKGKGARSGRGQKTPSKSWRKRPAPLTYMETSDSESQSQTDREPRAAPGPGSSADHSSLDIGAKPSPLKTHRAVKALTTSSKSPCSKADTRAGGHRVTDGAAVWQTMTTLPEDISFTVSPDGHKRHSEESRNVDKLLAEMARSDSSLTKIRPKPPRKAQDSDDKDPSTLFFGAEDDARSSGNILDDIFFSSAVDASKQSPPRKVRKQSGKATPTAATPTKTTAASSSSRATAESPARATASATSTSAANSSPPDSSVLDFLSSSTLKEEGVDCFSRSPGWKRRKAKSSPKPSPSKVVQDLVSRGEEDYQKLFRTGKLRRQPSLEGKSRKEVTESEADLYDMSSVVEKSPSLFS